MDVCLVAKSCLTLCDPHGLQPTRLLCPRDFLGKNTGVGCHFLLHLNGHMCTKVEKNEADMQKDTEMNELLEKEKVREKELLSRLTNYTSFLS